MDKIFKYRGQEITFLSDEGSVMINATEMSKQFSKQPSDWTRTKSSQEFIKTLSTVRNICGTDLVRSVQGGDNQGTWMHEDVAIEFARWLSPEFAIWCNDRIKELGKFGITASNEKLEELINNPDLLINLASQLKLERQKSLMLLETVKLQEPKVNFANSLISADSSILIGELAKILTQNGISIGQNRLFEVLRARGYLGQRGEYYNIPTQKAMGLGLFEIIKTTINTPNRRSIISTTTKVTGKGQEYFINKFLKQINKVS